MPGERMFRWYERAMTSSYSTALWGNSGFFNLGYWTPETRSQREASENLVEKLVGFLPDRRGRLLDVACGLGASTRYLLKYYAPRDLVGINLSEGQLAIARQNAPECTFLYMDAANLEFEDCSFENVMCIEAAFHFRTRDRFLREALRVLKPGGRLVLSDILYHQKAHALGSRSLPRENYIADPDEYGRHLEAAGFARYQVFDTTEESWQASSDNQVRFPQQQWDAGGLTRGQYLWRSLLARLYKAASSWYVRYYLLAWAEKAA